MQFLKKLIILSNIWFFFLSDCSAQLLFQNRYLLNDFTDFTSIKVDDNLNFWVFGSSIDPTLQLLNLMIKLDSTGSVLNQNYYQFSGNNHLMKSKSARNYDGTFSMGGQLDLSVGDLGYLRMDTLGQILSNFIIQTPLRDGFGSIISTRDSGNIIVGYMDGPVSGLIPHRGAVIKINKSGNIEWIKKYGLNGNTSIVDVVEKQNGNLFILGQTTDYSDTIDFIDHDVLIMETTNMGDPIDVKIFQSASNDIGYCLSSTSDSKIKIAIMTGAFNVSNKQELVIMEIDSLYNLAYSNKYTGFSFGVSNDFFSFCRGTLDNGILFGQGSRIVKLDSAGNYQWQNRISYNSGCNHNDAIDFNEEGFVMVGNANYSTSQSSGWVIKINKFGIAGCNDDFINPLYIVPVAIVFQSVFLVDTTNYIMGIPGFVTVMDSINVISECNTYVSDLTLNGNELSCKVFPTVTCDFVNILISDYEKININVFDIKGNRFEIIQNEISEDHVQIDVKNLPSGLYVLKLRTKNLTRNFKILKYENN